MKHLPLSALIFFSLFCCSAAYAQDSAPDPVENDRPAAPNENAPAESTTRNAPYTQADLNLMVANVQRPNAIVWFQDYIYTVCNGDWTIYRIDDSSGDTITFVFGVKNGSSMHIERSDSGFDILIPDPDSETLWRVNQDRQAPENLIDELPAPWGIARLDDGRLLITDTKENAILAITESGETSAVVENLRSPTGIAVDGSRIYFANGGSARRGLEWMKIDDDGSFSAPMPLITGLPNTTNIALASDGHLYFGYALGTRGLIGRIDPTLCLTAPCDGGDVEMVVFSEIPAPISLTISPDMRLFFHSRYQPEIYWLQLSD